jgi:hypothetical protein
MKNKRIAGGGGGGGGSRAMNFGRVFGRGRGRG